MEQEQMKDEMLERERVANIRKHWVRLVTACNSRCVFCLDTDTPRGVYLLTEDIHRELRRGREELNADKVILSGGEGSIHPKFIDFVRYAKEIGYDRVQTVTNGVMFGQREFYSAAVDAGLGEITFSLHGHTPELHDRLTGTPGAFHKLMKGMMRAIREGRIIVNVDVCINKQNVAYIDQIVDLALSVGVREFDLLHVIPQGVAYENRNDLFYDPIEHLPRLQKVFSLNRHPGVVIWTNRFPVEFLENLEDLIQDPHKMLDEVNGRSHQVKRYLDEGTPLECRDPERCQHCFIEPFCNTADRVVERQNQNQWEIWSIGAVDESSWSAYAGLTPDGLPFGTSFVGMEVDDLTNLEAMPVNDAIGIYVRAKAVPRMVDREIVRNPLLISVNRAEDLATLLAGELPLGVDIEIELNQRTAEWMLSERARLAKHLSRIRVHQPSHEFLKDAIANDIRNPELFFQQLDLRVAVSGLPACTAPNSDLREAPKILHKSIFNSESGRVDTRELARYHVSEGYWGKSLRCRDCLLDDRCDGAHINFLRDQGFKQLKPLGEGDWAEDAAAQMRGLRPHPPKRLRDGRPLETVAPSLPGYAPPEALPDSPLEVTTRRARDARKRRWENLGESPSA